MTKREMNKLRNRVQDRLGYQGQQDARAAWARAWESRRPGILVKDQQRARLAMLSAINAGHSLFEAEQIARAELAREEV